MIESSTASTKIDTTLASESSLAESSAKIDSLIEITLVHALIKSSLVTSESTLIVVESSLITIESTLIVTETTLIVTESTLIVTETPPIVTGKQIGRAHV